MKGQDSQFTLTLPMLKVLRVNCQKQGPKGPSWS